MSDDIQKTMEFIVNQQAQFSVNIQKLEENVQRLEGTQQDAEKRMTRLEGALVGLVSLTGDLQKQTNAKLEQLADAQKLASKEARETNERLNNLILVVERYLSGRQNGHS